MSNGNFINGALMFRIWRFDGSGEITAKFQYLHDAKAFAQLCIDDDRKYGRNTEDSYFYLVVCEYECSVKAFSNKDSAQDRGAS